MSRRGTRRVPFRSEANRGSLPFPCKTLGPAYLAAFKATFRKFQTEKLEMVLRTRKNGKGFVAAEAHTLERGKGCANPGCFRYTVLSNLDAQRTKLLVGPVPLVNHPSNVGRDF